MGVVGCFLPWDEHVHAGPNARRFIGPSEHPMTAHPYTIKEFKHREEEKSEIAN